MKVAILGCGPAGLLAAHACALNGVEFKIYSIKKKSPISGAQFIHAGIPGINGPQPDAMIVFSKEGTKQGYAKKVYGNPDADCSWDSYPEGLMPAWSMENTYEWLWKEYVRYVEHISITPSFARNVNRIEDLVISSIPAYMICTSPLHKFSHVTAWIEREPADLSIPENVIIYDGDPTHRWYRTSNMFGHVSREYGHKPRGQAIHYHKPTGNNCDCYPDMMRIGRFGKWEKGVLAHSAFFEVDTHLGYLGFVVMQCTNCSQPVRPVVCFDIDGTTGEYHEHFLNFAMTYFGYGSVMPPGAVPYRGGVAFRDWFCHAFRTDTRTFRDIKLAYRQGGQKRSMPVRPWARPALQVAREAGAEVWVTTTRPYMRLDNIDPDTYFWLKRHGIKYDYLIYGDHKYEDLSRQVEPARVCFVLDDLAEQLQKAARVFSADSCFMWYTKWNQDCHDEWDGFQDAEGLYIVLKERIETWKAQH